MSERDCDFCGAAYMPAKATRRFCSRRCAARHRWETTLKDRRISERPCEVCGHSFLPAKSTRRFCSKKCAAHDRQPPHALSLVRHSSGRVFVRKPVTGEWTPRYRALMEQHLGRTLDSANEVVHHINGNPTDDRIENLQALTRAEHIEVHRADLRAGKAA